jgi:hypothetical protein
MSKHRVAKVPGKNPAFAPGWRDWKAQNCGRYDMELQFPTWAEAMEVALMSDEDLDTMIAADFASDGGW